MVNVLFVCLGNICRSPTAHGVFRDLVQREGMADLISVDSAGTSDWHIGDAPDVRAQTTARNRNIDLSDLRARQAIPADFSNFEYVIAMDHNNHEKLQALKPTGSRGHLHMLLSFADNWDEVEIPDPYYDDGFERVLDMIEDASKGLLSHIRAHDL